MDFGTELKGCVCRINNCAIELFSLEEDLEIEDEDSWDLVGRDLRLKATFLYIDLSRVISSCESDERKKTLTGLANKFFYFMDELGNAVKDRSASLVQGQNSLKQAQLCPPCMLLQEMKRRTLKQHLMFDALCGTFKIKDVPTKLILLKLSKFYLKNKAEEWSKNYVLDLGSRKSFDRKDHNC
ncbi:hypothetical protein VPH35_022488 [Triticum aestivum]|uniref:Uncharacterized protein n=1 Tax=Triticum turgidum subsp. durum TaxID=4567 RepID=A0A9R1RAQ9_TRITD|nr:unnamed protein product [Triticum turgidum subsp. durum]